MKKSFIEFCKNIDLFSTKRENYAIMKMARKLAYKRKDSFEGQIKYNPLRATSEITPVKSDAYLFLK